MKKILIEDIKVHKSPINRPSVKNTIVKEEKTRVSLPPVEEVREKPINTIQERRRLSINPRPKSRKAVVGRFTQIIFVIVLIAGLVFWIGNIFKSAFVTITAKHQNIEYKDRRFIAGKTNPTEIDFEIMIETDRKMKDYVLTESKEISSKATGSIILYNEFSTKPEKLLAGTYVSDQDGKTYRLNNTVTIPGYKMEKLKKIPGQIEVGITSFLAGENYNGNPEKFYINSFKGTTKYSKIYGKIKNELKGGLQGLVYYLTEEDKIKLKQIAETSFKEDLFSKVKALLPSGYVLYKGAMNFSYKIDEEIMSETPTAKVSIEGNLNAILIREDSLIKNIIRINLPDSTKEEIPEIEIKGVRDLDLKLVNNSIIDKNLTSFEFLLNGQIEAVWNPNKETLKNNLLGAHKNEVLPIFRQNRGIEKAMVKIFPPWDKYIPNNPSKININIK